MRSYKEFQLHSVTFRSLFIIVQRVENTGEPIYGNAELEKVEDAPKPVPVNQFSEYVTLLKRDNNAGFEKQYAVCNLAQPVSDNLVIQPRCIALVPVVQRADNSIQ